jgi:hypothetical protein
MLHIWMVLTFVSVNFPTGVSIVWSGWFRHFGIATAETVINIHKKSAAVLDRDME